MKDLGVIFDTELNFVQHCKEKINIAYSYLGIIKRNFIYLDEDAFVMLYKSLVRSHLEYANSVWNLMLIYINLDLNTLMLEASRNELYKYKLYKNTIVSSNIYYLWYKLRHYGEMKRNTGVTGLVQFGWLKSGPRVNYLGAPT